ncbi:hypothetical protein HXX76_014954 [Chlamydomonas incerta]|uniref:Uncharacterized protein n=1 Tax=Chlamydomonas incerta TaxID=51695 RepID=A0A835SE65_CHLIN|nr:hypothetical protein HXX76_014954 [Chlamydomonas incerta]|eukprot:KAG2423901.1 hypothetical protein HXX76_014954 [Chlamydomonas incerta]
MFWDDEKLLNFIKTEFAWYYPKWAEIEPFIKKLDTSRYMLMHFYGGIYLDVDVECVTPFDSLATPLPKHAAWMGDYPEPMFLMSSARATFWLYALDRISRVWRHHDAWHSTGPQGLNSAAVDWVRRWGVGVLVPYLTARAEPAFTEFIKTKNNTVPWYQLSDRVMRLSPPAPGDPPLPAIWYSGTGIGRLAQLGEAGVQALPAIPRSNFSALKPEMSIGFVANELLDPPGCGGAQLEACKQSWCNATWPQAYVVHHCMNTWRGRIGTTRRQLLAAQAGGGGGAGAGGGAEGAGLGAAVEGWAQPEDLEAALELEAVHGTLRRRLGRLEGGEEAAAVRQQQQQQQEGGMGAGLQWAAEERRVYGEAGTAWRRRAVELEVGAGAEGAGVRAGAAEGGAGWGMAAEERRVLGAQATAWRRQAVVVEVGGVVEAAGAGVQEGGRDRLARARRERRQRP